jgi:hypothetical protein
MAGKSELLMFESLPVSTSGFREDISPEQPRLKRHMSEQTAQSNYDDEFDVDDDFDFEYDYENNSDVLSFGEHTWRKRNKENNRLENEVPRVNRAQTEGWLRVRNHVVR